MTTILVIEDIANIRKFISLNLRTSGYDVLEASTAEEAIALFDRSPSLIILDLALPTVDGWELLSILSIRSAFPRIPILLTTATVLQEGERDRYPNIVDVLAKPFSAEQLLQQVADAAALYPLGGS